MDSKLTFHNKGSELNNYGIMLYLYGEDTLSCFLTGVRVMEKAQEGLTHVRLREVYGPAVRTWETGQLVSKKAIQWERYNQAHTESLIIMQWCFWVCFCSPYVLQMQRCFEGSRDFFSSLHKHGHNVKDWGFPSQQTSAFVYVQAGMFLKGLMFSGGIFPVKCVLKDELTITFAEYP